VLQTPIFTMADIAGRRPQLIVVCIDVRDPGNAGTVARSAWAAGADAVVCCEGTVDLWNPKAVRSSAGAVLHVPIVAAGAPVDVLDEIGSWGVKRWGTACDGGADYATADLSQACALVVGNEAAGLPLGELLHHLDGLVSIPMPGGAGSLNVGMAAAVLCFEVARQRRHAAAVLAVPPTGDGLGPISQTGSGLGPISQTGSGLGPISQTGSGRGATADTGTGPGIALPTGAGH
jgi:TrmH family RNA methyltransferase